MILDDLREALILLHGNFASITPKGDYDAGLADGIKEARKILDAFAAQHPHLVDADVLRARFRDAEKDQYGNWSHNLTSAERATVLDAMLKKEGD